MAYLERDKQTGEQVAIKYIPRGATVRAVWTTRRSGARTAVVVPCCGPNTGA